MKTGSLEYIERANQRRGDLLSKVIDLERAIDQYIADYFIDRRDKRNLEIMALILSAPERMGFEGKRQVALWIATNTDKKLIDDYPRMFADIQDLISFRNLMVHSELDFVGFNEKIKQEITSLIQYKKKMSLAY